MSEPPSPGTEFPKVFTALTPATFMSPQIVSHMIAYLGFYLHLHSEPRAHPLYLPEK